MSEIKERLKETADACIKSYEAWSKDSKSTDMREALLDSVHDLRKVASRLEIEIALSERDEMASKPIPIPPHRAAKGSAKAKKGEDGSDTNILSESNDSGEVNVPTKKVVRRRRSAPKSASGNE